MERKGNELREALSVGVLACWGLLTPDAQQQIFEAAVEASQDPSIREDLAIFLHDHHPRTDGAGKKDASTVPTPAV